MISLTLPEAAEIKQCLVDDIEDAVKAGLIDFEGGFVDWNHKFHDWCEPIREERIASFCNSSVRCAKYIKKGDLYAIIRDAQRHAKSMRGEVHSVVPVTFWNLEFFLRLQDGLYDAQVYSIDTFEEIMDEMAGGIRFFQMRISLPRQLFRKGMEGSSAISTIGSGEIVMYRGIEFVKECNDD